MSLNLQPLQLLFKSADNLQGSMDKRLNIAALRVACWAPDMISAMLSPVPALEVSGLIEWQPRTFTRDVSGDQGGYLVNITLEGHADPENAGEEYFEFDGASSEDPIENHWNFDVLLKVYGGGKKPDPQTGKMVWPRTLSVDGEQGRNRLFGVESWNRPGLIWTRNFVSPVVPASMIQDLGTIFKTPPGNPTKLQNPPGADGNRDWLYLRARGRQRGNVWQLASSFELSGPLGWTPEMYPRY